MEVTIIDSHGWEIYTPNKVEYTYPISKEQHSILEKALNIIKCRADNSNIEIKPDSITDTQYGKKYRYR